MTGSLLFSYPYYMVRSKAKITSKGQITLPATVREALHVGLGDVVTFEIQASGVRVVPERAPDRFAAYIGKYRVGKGKSAAQVDRWLRDLRGH
ncbi:MAG: AbrB/MazE/SpoVT family DNA-binding domain-containing protein [Candidatus Baltobacteraceae bacterium]